MNANMIELYEKQLKDAEWNLDYHSKKLQEAECLIQIFKEKLQTAENERELLADYTNER